MSATAHTRGIPKTALKTTPGAAMMAPAESPREIRKRNEVSERVLESKRRSKYSYAV